MTALIAPRGRPSSTEFTYNAVGSVTKHRKRAGQDTDSPEPVLGPAKPDPWDPLNRLSTKAPASLPTVTYAYDLVGRVTSVSDSGGAFTCAYDTAGRNTSVTRPDTKAVSYEYDKSGNRTKLTWPDAFFVTYEYDQLDRMTNVKQGGTVLLATYAWDTLSRRTSLTFGNTKQATYSYALNDDLTQIRHAFKTQGSAAFGYNTNRVGQKTKQTLSDDRFLFRAPRV